jgi:hypothetical protein
MCPTGVKGVFTAAQQPQLREQLLDFVAEVMNITFVTHNYECEDIHRTETKRIKWKKNKRKRRWKRGKEKMGRISK